MSSEGATPDIAVDIVSIESTAAEGAVQQDVLDRKKKNSAVSDSEAHGRERRASAALPETNTSEDHMPETKEFDSEHQSSKVPVTDADRKEDEHDAESLTTDSEIDNVPDLEQPTQPLPAQAVPSWDPPPGMESCYVTEYSTNLFRAALSGDWEAVMLIAKEGPAWLRTGITKGGETVFHIAAAAKHIKVVEVLIKSDPSSLLYTNKDGSTPFCFAAASGVVEIAKIMQEKNDELPNIRGKDGMTPLHMAVLLGHRDMVWYLLKVTDDRRLTNQDRIEILTSCIDTNLFDVALHILKNNLHLALLRDARKETALHALARKPLKQDENRPSIWSLFSGSYTSEGEEAKEALELAQILWSQVTKQKTKDISESIGQPWRLLFVAARLGKVEFLTLLIQYYPDLIWKVDENKYTIFHIAVINRQVEIFKLIYQIGAIKDLIATYKDKKGNNMLHLASDMAPLNRLSCVSGAALQMQRELQWFQAVKQIVRSEYTEAENKRGKTPQALFSEKHKSLRRQGEEWMKKTAESCALVAALITTVVFTAAFQLPGGFNSETGSPVLEKKMAFVIFAMSNAVSLLSSTASILMFLSILTSRYAERDFLTSLPKKLMAGLILLLMSIATMVVGFTVTFFITFQEGLRWPPITVAILAFVPIILFARQQVPLLAEMCYPTYNSQNVFLPGKKKLFQVPQSETSVLKCLNSNTPPPQIEQRHVDHNLESYLPIERRLTDADIHTMVHTESQP